MFRRGVTEFIEQRTVRAGRHLKQVWLALTAFTFYGCVGTSVLLPPMLGSAALAFDGSPGQTVGDARQALFRQMMANPADLDIAFEYARQSIEAGDLEGAISTLERMLIFAPRLPRLQLELGVLYFRLGAFETARSYFEGAMLSTDIPDDVRAQVVRYQEAINAGTRRARFEGAFSVGLRSQSNANSRPASNIININGLPVRLDRFSTKKSDFNAFATTSLRYFHDLPGQGDQFEVRFLGHTEGYGRLKEYDLALAELKVGPVYNLRRFDMNATLGVYGIVGGAVLDRNPYLSYGGFGAELNKTLTHSSRVFVQLEYRRERFYNSTLLPLTARRSGERLTAATQIDHALSQQLSIFGRVRGSRRNASVGYLSSREAELAVGATLGFNSPFAGRGDPWTITVAAGHAQRVFDEPDKFMNRREKQRDREYFIEGALVAPVIGKWSTQATGSYRRVSSNYDLRKTDNFSASIGLTRRF